MKYLIILPFCLILFSCEGSNPLSSDQNNDLNTSIGENIPVSMLLSKANSQVITAGGNYRGTFGNGKTTATLQVRANNDGTSEKPIIKLNVTFVVSSSGVDGSKYNYVFVYSSEDKRWLKPGGKALTMSLRSKALAQSQRAYGMLARDVEKSLNVKLGRDPRKIYISLLPGNPIKGYYFPPTPDFEQINIH